MEKRVNDQGFLHPASSISAKRGEVRFTCSHLWPWPSLLILLHLFKSRFSIILNLHRHRRPSFPWQQVVLINRHQLHFPPVVQQLQDPQDQIQMHQLQAHLQVQAVNRVDDRGMNMDAILRWTKCRYQKCKFLTQWLAKTHSLTQTTCWMSLKKKKSSHFFLLLCHLFFLSRVTDILTWVSNITLSRLFPPAKEEKMTELLTSTRVNSMV